MLLNIKAMLAQFTRHELSAGSIFVDKKEASHYQILAENVAKNTRPWVRMCRKAIVPQAGLLAT